MMMVDDSTKDDRPTDPQKTTDLDKALEQADDTTAAEPVASPFEQPTDGPASDLVPGPTRDTPAPASAPAPTQKGGGFGRFVGLLTGGAVAAGLGFGLAHYGVQQGWPLLSPPPAAAPAEAVSPADLAALRSDLDRLATAAPANAPDLAPLEARLAALENAPAGSAGPALDLAPLLARIEALETRLAALPPTDSAAISAQIQTEIRARLQEAEAETDTLRQQAEALNTAANQRAALLAVQTALTSGLGLPEALTGLAAQDGLALPEALTLWTQAPVTVADLRDRFPDAARQALSDARSAEQQQTDGAVTDRLATFLMNQTGARSTIAREGDDADAILSRMGAAIAAGDLAAARTLLDSLPPPAQPALAPWAKEADTLLAAQSALARLISAL